MIGILDAGGGMRGMFSAGVYDYLMDNNITADYCIGVSAGAGNQITYIAGQRGRNIPFFTDYAYRPEYMSARNFLTRGSYLDLDYIYTTICSEDGDDPIDYDAFCRSRTKFVIVATEAETGQTRYFSNKDVHKNEYNVLKATCCVPVICKPYPIRGVKYFDGGLSDPIPYRKAFADGCDKLICVITRPKYYIQKPMRTARFARRTMADYPASFELLKRMHLKWNEDFQAVRKLEKEGKCLLICPQKDTAIDFLSLDSDAFSTLYSEGYVAAQAIPDFMGL